MLTQWLSDQALPLLCTEQVSVRASVCRRWGVCVQRCKHAHRVQSVANQVQSSLTPTAEREREKYISNSNKKLIYIHKNTFYSNMRPSPIIHPPPFIHSHAHTSTILKS